MKNKFSQYFDKNKRRENRTITAIKISKCSDIFWAFFLSVIERCYSKIMFIYDMFVISESKIKRIEKYSPLKHTSISNF